VPTTFEIHPSIGIARVGTSTEFFIGPEPGLAPPKRHRDGQGNLLRQATRFRVFRCERTSKGVLRSATEVAPGDARIEWTVHLANGKGEAELFQPAAGRTRRNDGHANRKELIIDPGPRTVAGPGQGASFDTGVFKGRVVPLGEVRTDPDGRLLVLGGFGKSDFVSPDNRRVGINSFADNDHWYDDVSDGPVRARLTFADGTSAVDAVPSWVVVAPPDFAPGIVNLITLYDAVYEAAVARKWLRPPKTPSFSAHILPILERAMGYQWVLDLARFGHGPGGPGDFSSRLARLADPAQPAGARRKILSKLRDPNATPPSGPNAEGQSRQMMPRLHDETNSFLVLPLTKTQYANMKRWADGKFVGDFGDPPAEDEQLPDALDRVALEACAGGAFFPGIEVGSILADPDRYQEPFRLDAARLRPGDVTRRNAVPWQADFSLCTWEGQGRIAWWPAQRPNQVRVRVDSETTAEWSRNVPQRDGNAEEGMVLRWHQLGVLTEMHDASGAVVYVESERMLPDVSS
jgi:hypothetical protein